MNNWDALLLGLIQGITEFLPISSSGHLILFQYILGYQNLKDFLLFDLVCHLGTLGAVLWVLADSLKTFIFSRQKLYSLLLALLPLFFLLPFLKGIKNLFENPQYLGWSFLFTAALLLISEKFGEVKPDCLLATSNYRDSLKIGFSQALAIIPGISRSGTTISTARLLGWKPQEAANFSFLLSIPTIVGGVFLELFKMPHNTLSLTTYFIGFSASFFVGVLSLKLLLRLVGTTRFKFFAWYLIALGMFSLYQFN